MTTTRFRDEFASALVSDRSHASIPESDRIFEPFIGSWDLEVRWYGTDGVLERSERGEWHFARVLEGRAIQDIWIVPPIDERSRRPEAGEYGTSLRFYDPDIGAWRSTWIGPFHRYIRRFIARRVNDEVVLDLLPEEPPPLMRWIFHDIQSDSFAWRNEVQEQGGWRIQQSFSSRRLAPER
ncbi:MULTISPECIES: hypothetical protein [unclassified Pseudoxanthomonas]|uniref:hypothetical protein n=1 Tax=unclassified Pseudoxanthomonas TaxID=2645906 RepID=UPI003077CCB0